MLCQRPFPLHDRPVAYRPRSPKAPLAFLTSNLFNCGASIGSNAACNVHFTGRTTFGRFANSGGETGHTGARQLRFLKDEEQRLVTHHVHRIRTPHQWHSDFPHVIKWGRTLYFPRCKEGRCTVLPAAPQMSASNLWRGRWKVWVFYLIHAESTDR